MIKLSLYNKNIHLGPIHNNIIILLFMYEFLKYFLFVHSVSDDMILKITDWIFNVHLYTCKPNKKSNILRYKLSITREFSVSVLNTV